MGYLPHMYMSDNKHRAAIAAWSMVFTLEVPPKTRFTYATAGVYHWPVILAWDTVTTMRFCRLMNNTSIVITKVKV